MLRLQSSILTRLLSSPSATYPISHLHRVLSATAPPIPPNPTFDVEDYLVKTCGLTRPQALKASGKLSHLESPAKPDAVLAFLAGLGLSTANVAAVVAKDPHFLCASVEKTLTSIAAGLTGLGLSRSEVARLVAVAPHRFRCRPVLSNLPYCLSLFGSYEKLLRVISYSSDLLNRNLDKAVKPNVAFLQECGINACGIASLSLVSPRLLGCKPERVREMAVRAEALGVPRGSRMFRFALQVVASRSEENVAAKVEQLKNTFRCSDAEMGISICKFPSVLTMSMDMLQSKSEFLISEVGLEPAYILHRPIILGLSLEGRLRPRYYVLKFLKENGLLDHDRDYGLAVKLTEEAFMGKFICPHKEAAPYLAEDYAAACRGEMTSRFRFT
ncbi:unnamed protein product [Alopecurus aequalis]